MRYDKYFYYVISSMLIFSTAPPNDDNRLAEHSPCSHNKPMLRKLAHSHFCCDPYHCRPPTLPWQLFSGVCARGYLEGGTRKRYQMICSMKIKQNKTTWWNSPFYSDPRCHLPLPLPAWPQSDVGARCCCERGSRIRLLDGMLHY